ncbi:beta-ketoacyl synthase N-terminal-like domain-containing protein [Streptomyces sp. NPDC056660]|uniref:beta-ketoacyl synthase N-terminal-like domain-containing protein n=1 Tax=Streptomyces sp. NPDC056660 TaxID=3345897 RepID=UPI0036A0049F
MTTSATDIAVIGVAGRFPDAWMPAEFWQNVQDGRVSVRELDDEELRTAGVSEDMIAAPDYIRFGTPLPGYDLFAADFFGVTPAEAEVTDPQQRLFLEACWEALEAAGHAGRSRERLVTGVYAGASFSTYAMAQYLARAREVGFSAFSDGDIRRGSLPDFLPAVVAYRLGLRGPAISVQTACSSSLTAVHQAVNALLAGDCDLALAGGTSTVHPPDGHRHDPAGIMSDDGQCRSFDAASTGTTAGAAVGVVVLRRLADALADGDPVLAVVKGSAVNNDGPDRPGFTAPSPAGVADVVSTALHTADVSADRLIYVEAHGSGTPLGDQVELLGLTRGLRQTTARTGFCGLGSVKANIGHCGSAAGIVGMIKALRIAQTGEIPPLPHLRTPRDPGLLAESPFVLDTVARRNVVGDRAVLVHSMGQGGTNVAVVLEPAPEAVRSDPSGAADTVEPPVRLILSARTRAALDAASRELADELAAGRHRLRDVAHTLRVGRRYFEHRRVVSGDRSELIAALRVPRPPAARTALVEPRSALVVRTGDGARPTLIADAVARALGCPVTVADAAAEQLPSSERQFVIVVGPGVAAAHRHVVRSAADADDDEIADLVDAALTAAWLDGVDVDWATSTPAAAGARRVPLPTYPFQRRRFWALDRIRHVFAAGGATVPGGSVEGGAPAAAVGTRPEHLASAVPAADDVEADLVGLWQEMFGFAPVGATDEFSALGGTSLTATRMALEIAQRHDGFQVNLHRVGGTRTTVRRIASVLRARGLGSAAYGSADAEGALIDSDLDLPLGTPRPTRPDPRRAVLLTGATGYVGAFLLHEAQIAGHDDIRCLVRARDEVHAWERVRAAAAGYGLPAPDPEQVRMVPGDLTDVRRALARPDGGLGRAVGQILHCAASVVFTESYRALRADNAMATADLLRWARENGVQDFGYVSSLAACSPTGPAMSIAETRAQPLADRAGGYGTGKWVSERLAERAERDGMRVRIWRPGLILGDSRSGACNPKDMTWRLIVASLAVGAHPADDRLLYSAPVDVVAKAIVAGMTGPGAVGRAQHLVHHEPLSIRGLFEELSGAGLPTAPLPPARWQQLVRERALDAGDDALAPVALLGFDEELGDLVRVEAEAWRGWLTRSGLSSAVDGPALARSVRWLAGTEGGMYRELLAGVIGHGDSPRHAVGAALGRKVV